MGQPAHPRSDQHDQIVPECDFTCGEFLGTSNINNTDLARSLQHLQASVFYISLDYWCWRSFGSQLFMLE